MGGVRRLAEPDIRVLVSNTGDASPSGESANKIRDNLQQAFNHSPVHVKIQASTASLRGIRDSIIKELQNIKIDVAMSIKILFSLPKKSAATTTPFVKQIWRTALI